MFSLKPPNQSPSLCLSPFCSYRSPLHCAVAFDNQFLVKYLVEHGASLFLVTSDGDTPLGVATKDHTEQDDDNDDEEDVDSCFKYLTGRCVYCHHSNSF